MSGESLFSRILTAMGLKSSYEPKHKVVFNFDELKTIIPAKYNIKWGYINELGEWIIEPKFEMCRNFADCGLAPAQKQKKWGFIDKSGNFVITPQFDDAFEFNDFELANIQSNSKWGLIDTAGNIVVEPIYDNISYFAKNGLAAVRLNDKYGFIDKSGKVVIDISYEDVGDFADNGLAAVQINKDDKWGYMNALGKMVIEPQYIYAFRFTNNSVAQVELEDNNAIINQYGEMIDTPKFYIPGIESENGLFSINFADNDDKMGCIDSTGKILIEPKYDLIRSFNKEGFAAVELDDKWGIIDTKGNIVLPLMYEELDECGDGYFLCSNQNKYGIINPFGKLIIEPKYDFVRVIHNTLFVKIGFEWCVVDSNGDFIAKPQYDSVGK